MTKIRVLIATAALAAAAPLQAQQADLKYVGQPLRVAYTTADTVNTSMQPMGMTMDMRINSVVEFEFLAGDSLVVKAMLKEFGGSADTPMGPQPVPAPPSNTVATLRITPQGPNPNDSPGGMDQFSNPAPEVLVKARAIAALPYVPGRSVRMGETWADTLQVDQTSDGTTIKGRVIVNGTYRADTTVAGKRLNIIDFTTVSELESSGMMQGQQIDQEIRTEATTRMLWDSARHVAVSMDMNGTMKADAAIAGMTINVDAKMKNTMREVAGS